MLDQHWGDRYFNALQQHGIILDKQDMDTNVRWCDLYAFGCKMLNITPEPSNKIVKTITSTGNIYEFMNKSTIKTTHGVSPYNEGVRYIKMHPANFAIWEGPEKGMGFDPIVKQAYTIEQINKFGMNGTFFGYESKRQIPNSTETAPIWAHAGILATEDEILCEHASHAAPWNPVSTWYPQRSLIAYIDGTFGIELIKNVSEISKPYFWAIGGIGLYPIFNPAEEGFVGIQADVLRMTDHTSIGVTHDGYIILARHYQFERQECIQHMRDLGCVLIIGLDGGGSTQYRIPDGNGGVFQRPSSGASMRPVPSMILASDL